MPGVGTPHDRRESQANGQVDMMVRLPGGMTWSNPYAQPEEVLRTLRQKSSPELQCVVYGLVLVHRLFITCPYKVNTEIGSQDLEF